MIQRWFGPSDAVPLSDQPDVEEATLPQPLESSLHTFQSPADAPYAPWCMRAAPGQDDDGG